MKYIILISIGILLSSCGSIQIRKKSSPRSYSQTKSVSSSPKASNPTSTSRPQNSADVAYQNVVETAKSFIGTPYRSGGTSSSGMDCSGLVITSFKEHGIDLPRISRDQANAGKNISLNAVQAGDLLFFNTSGRGISHVGIVERIEGNEVFFVHASSSKGVIISSIENSYWKPRFVKAVRVE